uniref:Uncharacterized protein n=1 Tax=Ditylenchus dipsaci TaxID=166011 RepID=A0A915D2F4_9BILA
MLTEKRKSVSMEYSGDAGQGMHMMHKIKRLLGTSNANTSSYVEEAVFRQNCRASGWDILSKFLEQMACINFAEALRQARRPQYLRRDANLKALTQCLQAANEMEFLKAVQHHLSKFAFVRDRADGNEAGNEHSVEGEEDIRINC